MLKELRIKNLATIEEIDIRFYPGLNILSGETGAGKSIIMGAIHLLLGGRASSELIRTGKDEALAEGMFEISSYDELKIKLENIGIEFDDSLIIKRIISRNEKSRSFINGSFVTLNMLKSLQPYLINIYGQHEYQTLLDWESHSDILDDFGELFPLRNKLKELLNQLSYKRKELKKLTDYERSVAEREDFLKFQLSEIESAKLILDEDKNLETERKILLNAETLYNCCTSCENTLYSSDNSIITILNKLIKELMKASSIDLTFLELAKNLETASYQLEDVSQILRDYSYKIHFDPYRLDEIETRLTVIKSLKRKYGDTIEEILNKKEEIKKELESLETREEQIEVLKNEVEELKSKILNLCQELFLKRKKIGTILSKAIVEELSTLGMSKTIFLVSQEENLSLDEVNKEDVIINNRRITERGMEKVEFYISPNLGEEPKPLIKIASGGELSRIMLAIKKVLIKSGPKSSLIFDEVDSGIGGKIAEVVGQKIKDLAKENQVLCITHLPQIARFADTHYLVEKQLIGEKTVTTIKKLNEQERIEELARMLGGIKITDITRKHARELIT